MSFKLSLEIGYYEPASYDIVRRLDTAFVQQVIVQAGGQLPEEVWSAEKLQRHRTTAGGWQLLGFLGSERVRLLPVGVLLLAIGCGPNPVALAFLRMLAADGCTIIDPDGPNTERVLETLAATEARWAARNKV